MPEIEEKISYGHTHDLSRMPTMWTNTYQGAVETAKFDQPARRPYYIIERCEHYEVCGIVDKRGKDKLTVLGGDGDG